MRPLRFAPGMPVRRVLLLTAACAAALPWAQGAKGDKGDKVEKAELRDLLAGGESAPAKNKPGRRDEPADTKTGRAAEIEAKSLAKLRERLEVTDDAEWTIIVERIKKVEEMRRLVWAGASAGRGGPVVAEKGKRNAPPEQNALRSAVTDKLPDAEIKLRLARAHEVHQHNEAKLFQAQSELRAILTVRQEAVAVMAGILPP